MKLPNLTKGGKGMVEERDMMADLGERVNRLHTARSIILTLGDGAAL